MITALMHFTLQRSSDENVKRVTVTSHRSGVTTVSDLAISTSLGFGSPVAFSLLRYLPYSKANTSSINHVFYGLRNPSLYLNRTVFDVYTSNFANRFSVVVAK